MSEAIITVEGLGKRYRLGASRSGERYTALRDVVAEAASAPFRAMRGKVRKWKSANGSVSGPHLPTYPPSNSAGSSPSNLPTFAPSNSSPSDDFWALKDVSFEVKQGEVRASGSESPTARRGIIGRNGAGKSTLLKILSRITEPTEARIKVRGRFSVLRQVEKGFPPELTGAATASIFRS